MARCTQCSETIEAGAQFCPRCGAAAPPPEKPHTSIDIGKISAPVPLAGVVFLTVLVLAPAFLIVGIALGVKALVYVGVALAIALIAVLVLGMFL